MGNNQLDDGDTYARWRDTKLAEYDGDLQFPVVELADPGHPSDAEVARLLEVLERFNMVLYTSQPAPLEQARVAIKSLGRRLGLNRLDANMCADDDAITPLAVSHDDRRRRYIPYTDRAISWHTDGYYNTQDRQIRGLMLYCVSPAADGGENQLMDSDLAYILLRERDPDYIRALMHPRAMTIPANEQEPGMIRPVESGPVFSFDPANGALHMRYTARSRSIEWRDDATTAAAVGFLADILNTPSPYILTHRMAAGHGLICNNVLHNRHAFKDTDTCHRMVLRARYYDRIANAQEHTP